MTIRIAVLTGLLLTSQVAMSDGSAVKIEYRGWLDDAVEAFYLPHSGGVQSIVQHAPDATSVSVFCEADSDFFCINSYTFTFAIPKCLGEMQTEWKFKEFEYQILESGKKVSLFGKTHSDLLLIRVSTQSAKDALTTADSRLVLFSMESGVVGYAREFTSEPTPTFWLVSQFGLGSSVVGVSGCTKK